MAFRFAKLHLVLALLLIAPAIALAQQTTYRVQAGDNLYRISQRFGISVKELKEINNLSSDVLQINQVLKVSRYSPPPAVSATSSVAQSTTELRSALPNSYFYTVVAGDNLYRIARNHDISLNELLEWNSFANSGVKIHPGQQLIIRNPAEIDEDDEDDEGDADEDPARLTLSQAAEPDSVVIEKVYVVQPKDTLYKIARENGTTVDELKRINSLTSNDLKVGQIIYIVGSPRPSQGSFPASGALTEEDLLSKDKIRDDLIMPLQEPRILSEYGLRNGRPHKGIDLGAKTGSPVFASLDGTVVYSGVQGSYGNVIVIEHPDFVMTVYAHNERNLVGVGEKVSKGQQIATVGSTGNATGPHVHFEYRVKGKAINPRKVLPLN